MQKDYQITTAHSKKHKTNPFRCKPMSDRALTAPDLLEFAHIHMQPCTVFDGGRLKLGLGLTYDILSCQTGPAN
ncbi:MAG: hypothetical protein DRP45_10050 [Candidatus Zixiibacteriota bacterium]|nr:MAG: hypothetical protein DRP45_10050 [candidate division Zixibacteria bacterium]